MAKVAVVTDSTACIPALLLNSNHITVTPQVLIWGEKSYLDGVDILPNEFYRRLKHAKEMPTTSQVAITTMKAAFEGLLDSDRDVLGLFISTKLSGTMQSAIQAREMLTGSASRIELVDTQSSAMAMGFQVLTVARAAQAGASLEDCRELALQARSHTGVYFVVDTLEFLRRGGRIGGAQALLGSALNIKPLLTLQEGRIEPIEKIRTKAKALSRLVDIVAERTAGQEPLYLAGLHANAEKEARLVLEAAAERLNPVEKVLASVSPVIGTHTGPGTIALAYMAGM
jgi:DegV family protein with EDD domain